MNTLIIGVDDGSEAAFNTIKEYSKIGELPYLVISQDRLSIMKNRDMNCIFRYERVTGLDGSEEMHYKRAYRAIERSEKELVEIVKEFDNVIIFCGSSIDGSVAGCVAYLVDIMNNKNLYFVLSTAPNFMGNSRIEMSNIILDKIKEFPSIIIDGQYILEKYAVEKMIDYFRIVDDLIVKSIKKVEVDYNLSCSIKNLREEFVKKCDLNLRCVESVFDKLKIDRIYHVTAIEFGSYVVIDDRNEAFAYPPYFFEIV